MAGLCLMGGLSSAGCGIGTDPAVNYRADGTLGAGPDAAGLLTWPNGPPPIDQVTWQDSATATFALG